MAIAGATAATYTPSTANGGSDTVFSVKVSGTCNSDSIGIATVHVYEALTATADVEHPDTSYCIGATPEVLRFTTAGGDGTTPTYQWYGNDVAIAGATAATYTPSTANGGSDTVFSVKVSGTCNSDSIEIAHVQVFPVVNIIPTGENKTYCMNAPADPLSVSATGGDGNFTYQWYGNDIAIAGATNSTYTPSTTTGGSDTTFSVEVTSLCNSDTITVAQINVYGAVTATSTSADTSYCLNADDATVVALSATVSEGSEATPTYTWYMNDGTTTTMVGTTETWKPQVATSGTFTYGVKISNGCGSDSVHVATVTVWSAPAVESLSITANTVACVNDTTPAFDHIDSLTAHGFVFTGGHNLNPAITVVSNTFSGETCNGSWTTVYRVTDSCGNFVDVTYIQPFEDTIAPSVANVANQVVALPAGNCQYKLPDVTELVRQQDGTSDNCTSSEQLIITQTPDTTLRFNQPITNDSTIAVMVTVKDLCNNSNMTTVNVTIPAIGFTLVSTPIDTAICPGDSVILTAVGGSYNGGVTYVWAPSEGLNTTDGNNVQASPSTSPVVYKVTATDLNNCSMSKEVEVSIYPAFEFNVDNSDNLVQTVCPGGSMIPVTLAFNNAEVQVSGLPNGITYNEATRMISGHPLASGSFTITATNPNGCGDTTLSGSITMGDTLGYTTTKPAECDSFDWIVSDGNGTQHTFTYTTSGIYRYATRTADNQCDSVLYLDLTVNPNTARDTTVNLCETLFPFTWYGGSYGDECVTTHIGHNQWGCKDTVTLHLNKVYSFSSDTSDAMCEGGIYEYRGQSFTTAGPHTITYHTIYGCDSTYTLNLTVKPAVTINIEWTVDCEISQYIITSSTNGDIFEWSSSVNDGQIETQSMDAIIHVSPAETTTYTLTADRSDAHFCRVSESVTLEELLIPTARIETHDLHISPDYDTWQAEDASENAGYGREWYVDGEFYNEQGETIHGSIGEHGINDSISLMLVAIGQFCNDTTRAKIPVVVDPMYVPNIFTPDKETNNRFGGLGEGISDYEIWVYSREGLLVFHSTSMEEMWDGTHQGKDVMCKTGAYTYKVQYRIAGQPTFRQKFGSVTMIR